MFLLPFLLVRLRVEWPDLMETVPFENPIDHFNQSDTRTFKHRAYESMDYVTGDKFDYAFVSVGGEGPLEEGSVTWGSMMEVAKNLSVAYFGLEHRFFGKTQPFPGNGLTPGNLTYLTIDQALADLANFIEKRVKGHERASENVRVITVGGSYPGALSSWFRLKYPHLAWASWASSAPVEIKNDFIEYDRHVANQVKNVSQECFDRLMPSLKRIESAIKSQDPQKVLDMKRELGFYDDQYDVSVLYVVVDILSALVQYNSIYKLLNDMCDSFTGDVEVDWKQFKVAINKTLEKMHQPHIGDADLLMANDTSVDSPLHDSRAWQYMTCTQVGWFQTASGDMRSDWVNLSYFSYICDQLFGVKTLPNEREMNNKYGGKTPGSVKVFFLNGGVDPWSTMSVLTPDESLLRPSVIIDGESHCSDLYNVSPDDSPALANAKQMIVNQSIAWFTDINCTGKCGAHGRCSINGCICESGYGGTFCDIEVKSKFAFDVAVICGVSIPTVIVVIIIFSLWLCVYRPRQRASHAMMTTIDKYTD